MKQGEAVFQAISEVVGGAIEGAVNLTAAQLTEVHSRVFSFFKSGQVVHSKNPSEAELLKYIPGLVNNWMRKDKRLNGGTKYVVKNPGSRSGSGDEAIRAMRDLLKITTDPDDRANIEKCIKDRLDAMKPQTVINTEALPKELHYLVKN